MRVIYGLLALVLFGLLVAGCAGDTRHDVTTDGDGSLKGLAIIPEPQSLDISDDEEFLLDWIDGYVPPATFRVMLESIDPDGTRTGIYTELETISVGHYRLTPTGYLPGQTFFILTVSGAGERVRAMYLSGGSAGSPPRTPGTGGAIEHVVE